MALAPLQIQRPQVSLIGGKELPKASGAAANAPNLSGLSRLATELTGKQDRNKALADALAGKADAGTVARNPDGSYVEPSVDFNRSPEYNAASINTRVENIRSDIRTRTTERFGEIQAAVDTPIENRVALMREALKATVEALPAAVRSDAWAEGSADIDARARRMAEQQVVEDEAAAISGIQNRILASGKEAASISMAGGDPKPALERIYSAYDELVGKRKLTQEEADQHKVSATRFIGAYATGEKIATAVRDGSIGLGELDNFITALEQGGEATLKSDAPDEDDGRPGRRRTAVYEAAELMQDWSDPETVNLFANRLRELHGRASKRLAAYEDEMSLLNYLGGLRPEQSAISSMHDDIDKLADQAISRRQHETAEGKAQLLSLAQTAKYLPKPLVNVWINTLLSSDYKAANETLQLWQEASQMRVAGRDVGAMIRGNMKAEDVAFLDAAVESAKQIGATGQTEAAQMDKWRQYQEKAKDPDNTVAKTIARFNEGMEPGELTFAQGVQSAFGHDYPGVSMPPWMNREFELTFHILSTMSGETDKVKLFTKAWEMTSARHPPSRVHDGGVQIGDRSPTRRAGTPATSSLASPARRSSTRCTGSAPGARTSSGTCRTPAR